MSTRQATNVLTRAFRSAALPVFWIRQEFSPNLQDAFGEMRRKLLAVTIAGTAGCELLSELETARKQFRFSAASNATAIAARGRRAT